LIREKSFEIERRRGFMIVGRWTSWGVGTFISFLVLLFQSPVGADERYTVKPGDSLSKIAKTCGVSVDTLKATNHLERENLKLNQVLIIPTLKEKRKGDTSPKPSGVAVSYVVKKGDSLYSVSKKIGLPVEEIRRVNQLRTDRLTTGQTLILSSSKKAAEDESDEEIGDDEETPEAVPEEDQEGKQVVPEPTEKWKNQNERSFLVRVVKTFLGVPYRLGGSTLKGIDCSAFVKKIYEVFNVSLPRTTWEQIRFGKKVEKNELEEGDLVFFKVPTRRASNRHVGIYIGNNEFVHASSRNKEVRVDNLNAPYFSKRFLNGVRVKGLEGDL